MGDDAGARVTDESGRRGDSIDVLLVSSSLEFGGAERQVVALANRLNAAGVETHVCCLADVVPLAEHLHEAARRLHIVHKRFKFDVGVVSRVARLVRRLGPSVVHMFLFDAEIAGRLAGRWLGGDSLSGTARRPVFIGSERNTDYTLKLTQRIALRLTRRYCDAIIANSNAGKRFQIRRLGVDAERVFVVHNGVDTTRFAPADAEHLRAELGIDPAAPVVGMFANFKRQKNHPMFFRMARRVRQRFPSARFLCVGAPLRDGLQGSDTYHRRMHAMIESMDLSVAVNCLGTRDDVTALYNLCDVTVLTSRREGTPNVLLESMACGVPVVATDVADNASIAPNGEVGFIVSYDDDSAMADRVADLLTDEENRRRLGVQARRHVREMFSLEALARKTAEVYDTVVRRRVGGEERFKALCGAT